MTALLVEAALFVPGYVCNFPRSPQAILTALYRDAALYRDTALSRGHHRSKTIGKQFFCC